MSSDYTGNQHYLHNRLNGLGKILQFKVVEHK